jgi:precorrin-2/cobalt-factor-2 C20-methyltransferase
MTVGRLVGVGVGPGDPEHLTLKALRVLRSADRVFVPATDTVANPGRAERIVAPHVEPRRLERLAFAMGDAARRAASWDVAGAAIGAVVAGGGTAAFATIGDPNLYSTFTYVAQTVRALHPAVTVETVPGITAMQDLAARSGTVLAEGDEPVTLLPCTEADARLEGALRADGTVVVYKGGRQLDAVLDALEATGRLERSVYGEQLGLEDEEVGPAAERHGRGPYMSTVIAPAARDGRRGGKLR